MFKHSNQKKNIYIKNKTNNTNYKSKKSIHFDIHNIHTLHKIIQKAEYFKIIPKGIQAKLNFILKYDTIQEKYIHQCTIICEKKNTIINVNSSFHNDLLQNRNNIDNGKLNTIICTQFTGNYIELKKETNTIGHLFVIDDIFLYKGMYVYNKHFNEKINYFYDFFKYNFKNPEYIFTNNELHCTLCYLSKDIQNIYYILNNENTFDYPIYKVNFITRENTYYLLHYKHFNIVHKNKINYNETKKCIVKASIQFDIYKVFECNTYKDLGILHIPDYTTSVFLNSIFRNIRENKNIDYIEESEDEDDFENDAISKFVDLEKEISVECVYNKNVKKYQLRELQIYETNT